MERQLKFLLLLMLGCAHHAPKPAQSSNLVETLRGKYDGWIKELTASSADQTGWISLDDCDGTLWMGEAVAAGHTGQLVLAEYPAGVIHRRPQASGECYPKDSATTVSNDMLTGYMIGMFATHDQDALNRLESYGEDHQWVMGMPTTEPRVILSPEGMGLLARAVEKLGGPKKEYDAVPESCFTDAERAPLGLPPMQDFEYHIQTLSIKLDGMISGNISSVCAEALKRNAEKYPTDALIQAVLGIYSGDEDPAINLLLAADYVCPTYVRPDPDYCTVHKTFAAKTVLERFP